MRELSDEEVMPLMKDLHRYMTCVRSDIWGHERTGTVDKALEAVSKPYASLADLPAAVQKLPTHGQEIYRAAFNAAYKQYDGDESKAHATAWAAVKAKYEQQDGSWVAKGIEEAVEKWVTLPAAPVDTWVTLSHGEVRLVEKAGGIEWYVPILKADDERRLVFGIVLQPGTADDVDSQGDFVGEKEIELAAHDFMKRYREQRADMGEQHEREASVDIVESYIAPADFEMGGKPVKKGSWVLGSFIGDDAMWAAVKAKELTGYSIGGLGERVVAS
jgi:cation transport regulator ChaB